MIPLTALPSGSRGRVVKIIGGFGAYRNLEEMGIVVGKEISVLRNDGGAILISVDGTKFAIGRGLAMKVMLDVKQKD